MNGVDSYCQLFCHHLAQRCANILADFDFACIDRNLAGFVDVNPGAYLLRHIPAKAPTSPTTGRLHRHDLMRYKAHQNTTSESLQKLPAVPFQPEIRVIVKLIALELKRHIGEKLIVHRAPPFIVAAAFWTAETIREYVPQRHIFPSRERTMSAEDGFEFLASRATPDMIMPAVQ